MRGFAQYNPIAVAVSLLAAAGIAMFCMDPIVLLLSLSGALAGFFLRNGMKGAAVHGWILLLFAIMAIINPLTNHNGATVLFVMNHNPITLEAMIYGVAASAMVITVLYWFRSFSQIMTSDKLLYLFGALSPKLALILSMTLRYVPLFGQQVQKVKQAQKALGLYKEDNIVDSVRANTRVLSVMVTWALENGIITADSMTARGYGTGRRSHFRLFRFTKADAALLASTLVLAAMAVWGILGREITWYPTYALSPLTVRAMTGYISYGVLAFLPVITDAKEAIKWRCFESNI